MPESDRAHLTARHSLRQTRNHHRHEVGFSVQSPAPLRLLGWWDPVFRSPSYHQARPPVPHCRGRPSHRSSGVGRAGPGLGDVAAVLQPAGTGPVRADHPRLGGRSAPYISTVVKARCPNAVRCADPFHVVGWATEALDVLRRNTIRQARRHAPADQRCTGCRALRHRDPGDRGGGGPGQGIVRCTVGAAEEPGAPRGAWSYSRCSRERLEEFSGSDDLPGSERRRGQQHVRKLVTGSRCLGRCAGGPA